MIHKNKAWLGIDPGINGAIAYLKEEEPPLLIPMPIYKIKKSTRVVSEYNIPCLKDIFSSFDPEETVCILERPQPMIKFGRTQGVSSTLLIGRGGGILDTALVFAGIPYESVGPKKWQNAMLENIRAGNYTK